MSSIGKRTVKAREGVDPRKSYPLDEAVKMVKARAKAKFDETIEVAINLGVDPRHADQMVRGVVSLPNGTGRTCASRCSPRARRPKKRRRPAPTSSARRISSSRSARARSISTAASRRPDMMGIVGRLGKVLGPRGLMPNPKVGTVTMDVTQAVKDAKGGAVEFRVEKAGIVHAGVGKASFTEKAHRRNVRALIDSVVKAKPAGAKGNYLKKISISSTMGPGVKIALESVGQAGRGIGEEISGARIAGGPVRDRRRPVRGLNRQSRHRRGENRSLRSESPLQIGFEPLGQDVVTAVSGRSGTSQGQLETRSSPEKEWVWTEPKKPKSVEEPERALRRSRCCRRRPL